MHPTELLIPQLLAYLVIVVISRLAVRESRKECRIQKEELAKKWAELQLYIKRIEEAAAYPSEPASSFLTEERRNDYYN